MRKKLTKDGVASFGAESSEGHDVRVVGRDHKERVARVEHGHGRLQRRLHGQRFLERPARVVVVVSVVDASSCNMINTPAIDWEPLTPRRMWIMHS